MVTDRLRERRERDCSCERSRTERGQVILIGAIALAFIILGVVVVFNGVVYTETLSSAQTGQSASTAEATELEVKQGVACVLAREEMVSDGVSLEEDDLRDEDDELTDDGHDAATTYWNENAGAEIETFSDQYRNATAHSRPAAVDIDDDPDFTTDGENISLEGDLTVTITYDTNDLSYERTVDVNPEACPS